MILGITGAYGFLGQHLVAAARNAWQVRALGRTATDECRIELHDKTSLVRAFAGCTGIVHAAAHIPARYDDPAEARACLETNTLGTLAVLEAAEEVGVKSVVIVSGNVYRYATEPVTEDAPVDPSGRATYYLASKAYADSLALAFAATSRIGVTIVRPSSIYGSGLRRGTLPMLATRITAGGSVAVRDGDRYRVDLVHAADVAVATVAAVQVTRRGNPRVFNLGSGATVGISTIATELAAALHRAAAIDVEPTSGAETYGFAALDSSRARALLGFQPRTLRHGLEEFAGWWRTR